jgi:O-acetyl-ADP-ribose deacetylase (regulator of RNase III)
MTKRSRKNQPSFRRPGPHERICANCKYMCWMVGIGQGVTCRHPEYPRRDRRGSPQIPSLQHSCEHFEFKKRKAPKEIILAAVDDELESAWRRHCGDLEIVRIHRGSILEVECDAVVSPANSFGFMDGGIDAAYTRAFGPRVQKRLQKIIAEKHQGELLVGTAEIVHTSHKDIPYLIAAPTMRVPMILENTVNPYLAARAVFLLIMYGTFPYGVALAGKPVRNMVGRVAFPGLGTGVGRVPPEICARQVRAAIEDVCMFKRVFPDSWAAAQREHQELYTDDIRDLQL